MAWTERYVRADAAGGGDGTTNTNSGANGAFTLAEAITDAATPHTGYRYNVLAGTYANTTTSRTFNAAGTSAAPIWWRGFKSVIGDMDGRPTGNRVASTDIPKLTFTTGQMVVSGTHQYFSNIHVEGAPTGTAALLRVTGQGNWFWRCRSVNTEASSSGARALSESGTDCKFLMCYFAAVSNVPNSVVEHAGAQSMYYGNVIRGGKQGMACSVTPTVISKNVFISNATDAIELSATSPWAVIVGNIIYNPGGHGILLPSTANRPVLIINNIFHTVTAGSKYGISYPGSNPNFIARFGNAFYNVTTAENGFLDTPAVYQVSESSDPFDAAGSDDFDLKVTANSYETAVPGLFEGVSFQSYESIGAMIPHVAGSSGGVIVPAHYHGIQGVQAS